MGDGVKRTFLLIACAIVLTGCGVRFFYVPEKNVACLPICVDTESKENWWMW